MKRFSLSGKQRKFIYYLFDSLYKAIISFITAWIMLELNYQHALSKQALREIDTLGSSIIKLMQ